MRKFILILAFFGAALASEITQSAAADCQKGDMRACAALGEIYQNGFEGEAVDYEKALKFNQKACDGDVLAACANLGLMHASGQGTSENFAKATELFERACAGGEKFACSNLGVMYLEGVGIAEDAQKGLNFLQKACDSGDFGGCVNLAEHYEEAGELAAAAKYYAKTCEIGKDDFDAQNIEYNNKAWKKACKKRNLR